MKLDQLTTPLIPRSTTNCLDLGILFYGRYAGSILAWWAAFALPLGVAVYFTTYDLGWDLRHVAVMLHFASAPLGVILAERAIEVVLGGSFDDLPKTPERRRRTAKLIVQSFILRAASLVGYFALFLPGWWIAVRWSFLVETACLSDLQGRTHDRRWKELVKQELGSLLQRSLVISFFLVALFLSILFTLDFITTQLFNMPILLERLGQQQVLWVTPAATLKAAIVYLCEDPLVLTVSSMLWLLVYPVARFAWFFCYIDLRVRGDFWDLELRFQKEVERLGETAT